MQRGLSSRQFINAINEDIKGEMRVLGTRFVDNAIDLCLSVEEKLKTSNTTNNYNPALKYPQTAYPSSSNQTHRPSPQNSYSNRTHPIIFLTYGEIRRISEKELQYKRERGLCLDVMIGRP